jgi:type I restriction enzyme M protein
MRRAPAPPCSHFVPRFGLLQQAATGALTRGSGSKNEDKERNIRKWFVDRDLIDGVILLPDNLFYNTGSAGVIVVLNKRKPAARRDKIVLLNASKRLKKGKPKNYIPEEVIRPLATAFLKGDLVDGEIAVITRKQAEDADYNLSPSRWVEQASEDTNGLLPDLIRRFAELAQEERGLDEKLIALLGPVTGDESNALGS